MDEIEVIAKAASRVGAVLLIDESAAQYLGPRSSSACIVHRLDNLVVVRGFTKAYSLCGLRAGCAIASTGLAERVRELVAPLQVSEITFHAVSKMLAAGDIFGDLRARIRKAKSEFIRRLEASGLVVIGGHEILPWVMVRNVDGETSRLLEERGIIPLHPATPPIHPRRQLELLRLTVPLSERRMRLFNELMTTTVVIR
jgi:histidinol-phosphate/aromatic aminotransferase/cobyric acid decarboxylase-like protein